MGGELQLGFCQFFLKKGPGGGVFFVVVCVSKARGVARSKEYGSRNREQAKRRHSCDGNYLVVRTVRGEKYSLGIGFDVGGK